MVGSIGRVGRMIGRVGARAPSKGDGVNALTFDDPDGLEYFFTFDDPDGIEYLAVGDA